MTDDVRWNNQLGTLNSLELVLLDVLELLDAVLELLDEAFGGGSTLSAVDQAMGGRMARVLTILLSSQYNVNNTYTSFSSRQLA